VHVVLRERHDLEAGGQAEDLGQDPADLLVLSFTDGDLGAFAAAWRAMPAPRPTLRLANLRRLTHPLSVDLWLERTASGAKGVLVRLLGGVEYWRYGLEELSGLARRRGIALAVVPGDGRDDPRLAEASTVPASTLARLRSLCDAGGPAAAGAALAQLALASGLPAAPAFGAAAPPSCGFYAPGAGQECALAGLGAPDRPRALVVFYRSVFAAADCGAVDGLLAALAAEGFDARAAFVTSLKDPEAAGWLRRQVARLAPDVVVNATAFAVGGDASPFDACDAPVLQVAVSGSTRAVWAGSERGLAPADLAMHVALPEIDGRLFAGVVSFKEPEAEDPDLRFSRLAHSAEPGRCAAVAARAAALARLRRAPRGARRVAVVLSTYPGREDQLAHAVGLDAPESAAAVLADLAADGWAVADAPADGRALMDRLRVATLEWPVAAYRAALATLGPALRDALDAAWGPPEDDPSARDGAFRFRAVACGAAVVALQPERGRAEDRKAAYHDLSAPPRHGFAAFYLWLRHGFDAHALVHMGAHGTLEWTPGKAVALSAACWPEALPGPLPVVYPFVVNDPGEASQAKRRLGAVTLGHVTPPLRTAGVAAGLGRLESLLDEYSTADGLDPRRRAALARAAVEEARASGLAAEAGLAPGLSPEAALARLDAFVCDVKETQFLDGLHVFGRIDPGAGDGPVDAAACAAGERGGLARALDGRFVAPGPAGSPWRGRRDVAPTGRNLFAVDPRAVPSRHAFARGRRLADALVTRRMQDEGEPPRSVVIDLWGSATMRTGGEDFAAALWLLGVEPTWDDASGRVTGFEIVPSGHLGRPRVDVTLRVSGLFRDVFPALPALFEQAAAAVRALPEGLDESALAGAAPGPRVFGPAPGAYGIGAGAALTDLTDAGRAAVAEAWLAGSDHALGGATPAPARAALEARVAGADAFLHTQDLPETDLLLAPDYAAHEAGFVAAAAALGNRRAAAFHADATRDGDPRLRTLPEAVARAVRGRAANPGWIAGQMRHGYRGAAEIAWTLDQMAAFANLAGAATSAQFDLFFDATLGDDAVREFLERENPAAAAEMRRRFRDLAAAGLWASRRNSVAAALAGEDAA
jgi:cobaltochelatase CobN